MSFLKELFSIHDNKENITKLPNEQLIKELPKIKRDIPDFFKLDFKNVPDESYIAGDIELNTGGKKVQTFRKTLDYKECGLFDTVEVIVIEEIHKNIVFTSYDADNVKIEDLKELIDSIFLICGNDDDNKGKFTKTDILDYKDTRYIRSMNNRIWNKKGIMIDRFDDELSITIHGIDKY